MTELRPDLPPESAAALSPAVTYLNASHGVASWLLTRDHKRIALLYLGAVTFMARPQWRVCS